MREYNFELLLQSLQKLNIKVFDISADDVVLLSHNSSISIQTNTATNSTSYVSGWIADDKYYAKAFLRYKKIPVVKGYTFRLDDKKSLMRKAKKLSFPLVIKPTQMGHGEFVISNIENKQELEEVYSYLTGQLDPITPCVVEEHFHGEEYRCFVTKTGFFAAVHRKPASIIGDGESTVNELIDKINYQRMNPRDSCLCTIKKDWLVMNHLKKSNMSLNSIPKRKAVVQLRPTSNVSQGGDCIDVTESVHPSVKNFAKKVLNAMPYVSVLGIDLLCEDISQHLSLQKYSVCELNTLPGLSLHTLPGFGKSREVDMEVANIIKKHF